MFYTAYGQYNWFNMLISVFLALCLVFVCLKQPEYQKGLQFSVGPGVGVHEVSYLTRGPKRPNFVFFGLGQNFEPKSLQPQSFSCCVSRFKEMALMWSLIKLLGLRWAQGKAALSHFGPGRVSEGSVPFGLSFKLKQLQSHTTLIKY